MRTEFEATFTKEENDSRAVAFPLDVDGYLFEAWKGRQLVEARKRRAADFTGLGARRRANLRLSWNG